VRFPVTVLIDSWNAGMKASSFWRRQRSRSSTQSALLAVDETVKVVGSVVEEPGPAEHVHPAVALQQVALAFEMTRIP